MDNGVTKRIVDQLLTSMGGLEESEGVFVIGATNRLDLLDRSLLRPGRFDKAIMTAQPKKEDRLKIFEIYMRDMPLSEEVDVEKLAERTEGYTGADIRAICREAGFIALREDMDAEKIGGAHFEKAMEKVMPSVTPEIMDIYLKMKKDLEGGIAKEGTKCLHPTPELSAFYR
jgi:ATP-dependent 26S proteasome regulatory subunit